MHGLISQNGDIYSNSGHHPRNLDLKFQLNRSNRLDIHEEIMFFAIAVTVTSHIFINIFQLP